jgi:hypothetical protein
MKLFNKMLDRMKFLQIEKLCFQQAEEILGNRWPCEKFSVNSPTVIKNDVVERLEKQPLNFFTVYNNYRNLSSFFSSQSVGIL